MKKVLTVFCLVLAGFGAAQAQTYQLGDDSGDYTLPSGSKVACVTMGGAATHTAVCTMKLAGGDTAEAFPERVVRFGTEHVVIPGHQSRSRAWADCGEDCITGKE